MIDGVDMAKTWVVEHVLGMGLENDVMLDVLGSFLENEEQCRRLKDRLSLYMIHRTVKEQEVVSIEHGRVLKKLTRLDLDHPDCVDVCLRCYAALVVKSEDWREFKSTLDELFPPWSKEGGNSDLVKAYRSELLNVWNRCESGGDLELYEEAQKKHGRGNAALLQDLTTFAAFHAKRLGGTSLDRIMQDLEAGRYKGSGRGTGAAVAAATARAGAAPDDQSPSPVNGTPTRTPKRQLRRKSLLPIPPASSAGRGKPMSQLEATQDDGQAGPSPAGGGAWDRLGEVAAKTATPMSEPPQTRQQTPRQARPKKRKQPRGEDEEQLLTRSQRARRRRRLIEQENDDDDYDPENDGGLDAAGGVSSDEEQLALAPALEGNPVQVPAVAALAGTHAHQPSPVRRVIDALTPKGMWQRAGSRALASGGSNSVPSAGAKRRIEDDDVAPTQAEPTEDDLAAERRSSDTGRSSGGGLLSRLNPLSWGKSLTKQQPAAPNSEISPANVLAASPTRSPTSPASPSTVGKANRHSSAQKKAHGTTPRYSTYRKWSDAEEEAIRVGMDKHGEKKNMWLAILEDDQAGVFQDRTTMDIKDKWRNMQKKEARMALEGGQGMEEANASGWRRALVSVFSPDSEPASPSPQKSPKKEKPMGRAQRHSKRAHREGLSQPNVRKKRQPWSPEEVEAIKLGMEKHTTTQGKTSWLAILEEHDTVFIDRTTMDIKDKWRNMQKAEAKRMALAAALSGAGTEGVEDE